MFKWINLFSLILIAVSCSQSVEMPPSRTVQHIDNYHGTLIADPYRWLENFTSAEVREWVNVQNTFTETFLENPKRAAIKENLGSIWISESISTPYKVQDKTFYYLNSGEWQQSKFMVKDCADCDARVLLDPNTFSTDGTIALASVSVSPNAELLAYSISDGGSDWRSWKVLNIESGEELSDNLLWSKFSGAEWAPDSSGFFYNKYPIPANEALADLNSSPAVMFHTIGQNQTEDKIVKQDFSNPKLSWSIQVSDDGLFKILYTSKGTDERNLIAVAEYGNEEFIPLVSEFVADYSFIDSFEKTLWFYTDHNAPNGKVVKLNFEDIEGGFQDVIPETNMAIDRVDIIYGHFVVNYTKDTFSEVRYFDEQGNYHASLETQALGTISGPYGKLNDTTAYFSFTNLVQPTQIFEINFETGEQTLFWEEKLPGFNASDYVSNMVFYTSKDGTKVPLHISHKKDLVVTGKTPVLLYGYGGFDISQLPRFSKRFLAWMNQNGVFALANLRGGSEYGEAWHQDGMLLNKQNVFDDFAYAAKYLHSQGIGSSSTTAIQGRSNGGLLVGATMLQYPDTFGFAIPQVGVMDMLRFNKFTIGWAWESDYGSPQDPIHFKNLLSYSPYHNIKQNVCYPPTLVTTSERDDRVVPSHSYKFAARLQNLQSCSNPILLRVETRAGHGAGTPRSKQIEEIADIYGLALTSMKQPDELN